VPFALVHLLDAGGGSARLAGKPVQIDELAKIVTN
jgi:hypothetical protein